MCTDLYYCDPEYVYEEQFNTVYHEDQVLLKHQIMESMGKLSLGFILIFTSGKFSSTIFDKSLIDLASPNVRLKI